MSFNVLIADPPWSFGDALPGDTRGASKQYPCLSVEEICDFKIPEMEKNSYLVLWRVSSMVEEAYQVCRAWGFKPKTELVWRKMTVNGLVHFGMGRTLRASHETAIIAARGKPKPKSLSVRTVFDAPVGRHSEKPDKFYEIVEEAFNGPYAELFARRRRPGWTCFGNELPLLMAGGEM